MDSIDSMTTVSIARRPASAPTPTPQRLGPFELVRELGAGGMGVVFEARHTELGRRVALKLVRSELASYDEPHDRLLREAQAMARVAHPNVVTVFEVGRANDRVFLAMELVDGVTLRDWVEAGQPWRVVVDMFVALGRGLIAVHRAGLVHRDVNPSNVFVAHDGTPKLGDFGLARVDGEPDPALAASDVTLLARRLTAAGSVLGTPAYMAPEQRVGECVDARADQFAFGVSLHEALTGQIPRDGTISRRVPRPLRAILARATALEPDARFPSLAPLLAALTCASRGALAYRALLALALVACGSSAARPIDAAADAPIDAAVTGCAATSDCDAGEMCRWAPQHACGHDATRGACEPAEAQLCPDLAFWVCGCDGQVYINECISHSSAVDVDYGGPCRPAGTFLPCTTSADCPTDLTFHQFCVDDPRDACDPTRGDTSCAGLCVHGNQPCGDSLPCPSTGASSDVDSPDTEVCVALSASDPDAGSGACVYTSRLRCVAPADCGTGEVCVFDFACTGGDRCLGWCTRP